MTRGRALFGSLVFLIVVPGTVVGLVPWLLTQWHRAHGLPDDAAAHTVGALLMLAGLLVLIFAVLQFATEGVGTPAPLAPTRQLVVSGPNRFVRNPMYLAVVAVLLGEALQLSQLQLLGYAVAVAAVQGAFVHAYEEPRMSARFGEQYELYRKSVRAWLPRITPWRPPWTKPS